MKTSRLVYSATVIAAIALFCDESARAASRFNVTFYGYPDNDPPGKNIAHPVIHREAGGTGTSQDPITVAMRAGRFTPGTRMYVPSLRKYLILEDTCASCAADHIDIWMESDARFRDQVLECENAWTPDRPIEVELNPPDGRPVSTTQFFDKNTGRCNR
jgi:3D (Asp-Asp-Asp) domain-containing protein